MKIFLNFLSFSAALFSHSRRHMEDDTKVNVTSKCKDIARQLIENETGKRLNVVLGGGLRSFLPKLNDTHPRGRRSDERNLTDEWLNEHDDGDYVTNRKELEETTANHVLGIFSMSHLRFKADQNDNQPSLTEMTTKAIKLLTTNNEKGFLLIVESAKIDLAHHLNNAYRALDETLELDKAVAEAMKSVGKSS
jgi:alkaline phosphatase